jgi:NTE family protein
MGLMSEVWVFGGGGLGGIAWETGMLAGLSDEGVTIAPDATIIGTSAGSTVAAQVAGGTSIAELYERQLAGVPYEISKSFGVGKLFTFLSNSFFARSAEEAGRKMGRSALAAKTGPAAERLAVIEARLPEHEWSSADLWIVTVDALTGESRIIRRQDGVPLVTAVAASCAIPMVWPPVMIDGRAYIDGGMRSSLNLDLAPSAGPVVALAPTAGGFGKWARIDLQRNSLGASRSVTIVTMGTEAKRAQGPNSLDKTKVPAVAAAGREQGKREATRILAGLGRP